MLGKIIIRPSQELRGYLPVLLSHVMEVIMNRPDIRDRVHPMDRFESKQTDQAMSHGLPVGVLFACGVALMLLGAFVLSRPTDLPVGAPVAHSQLLDRSR